MGFRRATVQLVVANLGDRVESERERLRENHGLAHNDARHDRMRDQKRAERAARGRAAAARVLGVQI